MTRNFAIDKATERCWTVKEIKLVGWECSRVERQEGYENLHENSGRSAMPKVDVQLNVSEM